jgi:hypothetical protein
MPNFTLAPVGADDFGCSARLFPFTVESNIDAAPFWAELNGPTFAGTLLPLGRSRRNTSRTFSNPRERSCRVTDDLVATAIDAAGGQNLWNTLRGLTVRHVNRHPNMGDEGAVLPMVGPLQANNFV